MAKTTSETTLKKILEKPEAEKILLNHGVPCMSCPMASFEMEKLEIGKVCKMYGIDSKKILKDLNK
ncbi:MAG: disulfide oxidoreductase [Patescibacteria group bacterium]